MNPVYDYTGTHTQKNVFELQSLIEKPSCRDSFHWLKNRKLSIYTCNVNVAFHYDISFWDLLFLAVHVIKMWPPSDSSEQRSPQAEEDGHHMQQEVNMDVAGFRLFQFRTVLSVAFQWCKSWMKFNAFACSVNLAKDSVELLYLLQIDCILMWIWMYRHCAIMSYKTRLFLCE